MADIESYDDELFDDGFNEQAAAATMQFALWKRLFRYTLAYRKELVIVACAGTLTALVEITFPLLTGWVVDDVERNGADAAFGWWIAAYAGCAALLAGSVAMFVWGAGKVHAFTSHDIRREAFANLQRLSFSYYDYRPTGWLMARLTADCNRLTDILAWAFLDVVWGVTMMVGVRYAGDALAAGACGHGRAAGHRVVVRQVPQTHLGQRPPGAQHQFAHHWHVQRVHHGRAHLQGIRARRGQRQGLQPTHQHHVSRIRAQQVLAAVYLPMLLILAAVAINLVLGLGGALLFAGVIATGALITFMMYARIFFDPVVELGNWFAEMQMAQAAAERVLSLIDAKPDIEDSHSVQQALAVQRAALESGAPPRRNVAIDGGKVRIEKIELRNVGFSYDEQKPVLQDIDLTARIGETIAIVGPTGGGKSTLVNVICRFYEPTSGQVLIDGVDYRSRGLHWLQSNLGMVLQNAHVFSGTIRENIRYGRLAASDEEIVWCAKLAGAHDFIVEMENGYDTQVGEAGGRLSAGQKQLVSFARAILAEPQILVMDEATSSVDTETEMHIQQGLKFVLQGRISFVIAHRLSTIRNATRIIVVAGGRIVESGDHIELIALGGHYAALYREQSSRDATRALAE